MSGKQVKAGTYKTPLDGRPIRLGITGAGPAGLCIAGILAREAPGRYVIDVYERDSRERDQGSGWDLDSNARETLKRAGVDPVSISRPGVTSMRIYKPFQEEPFVLIAMPQPLDRLFPGDPETNRHAMREGLLAALGDAATVKFRCGAFDIRANDSGGATLLDKKGEVLGDYDIVMDTCGVATPLRKYRVPNSELKDWYTGLTLIGGMIKDPETELDPEVVRRLGQGSLMVIGDRCDENGGISMWMQRFGCEEKDHRATFAFMIPRPGMGDLAKELGVAQSSRATSDADEKETIDKIKTWIKAELGDKWDPMYRQCVDRIYNVAVRPLFMFDPSKLPIQDSPLPLVCAGDALHALPPFTGTGGNFALADAGDMATFLVAYALGKEKQELLPGLRQVEMKCFERGASVARNRGLRTKNALNRELTSKRFATNFTFKKLIKGSGDWTIWWRIAYVFALFYMFIHKITGYGMPPKGKAKSV